MSRKVLAVVMLAPAVPFVVLYVWLIDVPKWIEDRVEGYCDWEGGLGVLKFNTLNF